MPISGNGWYQKLTVQGRFEAARALVPNQDTLTYSPWAYPAGSLFIYFQSNFFIAILGYLINLWEFVIAPPQGEPAREYSGAEGDGHWVNALGMVGNIEFVLNLEDFTGSRSYGEMNYGNYGAVSAIGLSDQQHPVQWINFAHSVLMPPHPNIKGWRWHLKPGVKAGIAIMHTPPLDGITVHDPENSQDKVYNPYANQIEPYEGGLY
jgi:hypothetical protein